MKEKFEMPHADKVVGVPSEYAEHQETVERNFAKFFEAGGLAHKFEIEKTPKDMEIIGFAEESVKKYLQQYGRKKDLEVPAKNIHLYEEGGVEKLTKGKFKEGSHAPIINAIAVDRKRSNIDFTLRVFHEMFHTKSYKVFQVTKEGKPEVYRSGFSITSRDGKITYFDYIEEAITAYMERKFYKEIMFQNSIFKEEINDLIKENKEPEFSRSQELENLNKIVFDLYESNKDKFQNEDEVMDLFIEAQATGNLLKVGRFIEKTFGKGSFRKLGEKTASN